MALIEIELSPAWKRIETEDEEKEDVEATEETAEEKTAPAESETAGAVGVPAESETTEAVRVPAERETPRRRLLTGRRVLALGVVVGAVLAIRTLRRTVRRATGDEESVDVDIEAGDERTVEQ